MLRRHIKVRHDDVGTTLEYCEDFGCRVRADGLADCGRLACPSCGSGGANLSAMQLAFVEPGEAVRCDCGHSWAPHLKELAHVA